MPLGHGGGLPNSWLDTKVYTTVKISTVILAQKVVRPTEDVEHSRWFLLPVSRHLEEGEVQQGHAVEILDVGGLAAARQDLASDALGAVTPACHTPLRRPPLTRHPPRLCPSRRF